MDIGHRMKELRIQYGLTQQELADRAELTKSEFCSDFRDTTPQAHAARGLPQHTKVSHVRYLPDIFSASDHTKEPHQTPVLSCRQPKAP